MKKIEIFQENSESIILLDDDYSDLLTYTKKVNEILESTKVCILQTSFNILSLKPSKINAILISEVEDKKTKVKEKSVAVEKKPEINMNIKEDIIKD
jgi:hypothetical protein